MKGMNLWSRRLDLGAMRLIAFNDVRTPIIAAIGGAAGLGFSLLSGTFSMWAWVSVVALLIGVALALGVGSWPRRRYLWFCLAPAPFFNEFAFIASYFYFARFDDRATVRLRIPYRALCPGLPLAQNDACLCSRWPAL